MKASFSKENKVTFDGPECGHMLWVEQRDAFAEYRSPHVSIDILLTWLAHPGTALYLGYNTNSSNLSAFEEQAPGSTRQGLVNDGRRAFVKFSYQFRM
jgi:hypothetical protein